MPDGLSLQKTPVVIPQAYAPLAWTHMPDGTPIRYKVYHGGRGSGKSHNFARALVAEAYSQRHLILCTRQFQNSITDSVYRVVEECVYKLGLARWFEMTRHSIYCTKTGSEFIFKGLERNINEIRSLEGVTRCWLEEANSTRFDSWMVLDPTVRTPGSQIWISYNPENEEDPIHKKFVIDPPPPNALVRKTSWRNNPWFKKTELQALRLYMLEHDPDNYDWVWEGECRRISEASIFRGNFDIELFDTPTDPSEIDRFYFGADWGFANDPSVLIRCWIRDEILYIDHEAYAVGVEIDDLPALFAGGVAAKTGAVYPGVPGCLDWPIFADSARPETISYLARRAPGFPIYPADKWKGCVEDGIAHLKGFKRIKIHPRCEQTAREFRLYSYATDPRNSQIILPKIVDRNNHCLVADTKVSVPGGRAKISEIKAGDLVATRLGLRSVTWAGISGQNTGVISVITVGGHVITGTPDHRVYTNRGFIRMAEVVTDDSLWLDAREASTQVTERLTRSITAAVFTAAIRTLADRTPDTTNHPATIRSSFTGEFGWTRTGLFLTASMSIIKTATRSIMNRIISNVSRTRIIWRSIHSRKSALLGRASIWPRSRERLPSGIVLNRGGSGTLLWPRRPISQPPLRRHATIVESGSLTPLGGSGDDGVHSIASMQETALTQRAGFVGRLLRTILPSRARHARRFAEPDLGTGRLAIFSRPLSATGVGLSFSLSSRGNATAPNRVLAIVDGMIAGRVFDMTVDAEHEFFANGVLVHNCIDACRYSLNGYIMQRGNLGVWGRLAS